MRRPNQLDLAALRDAIGFARLLYASTGADHADPARLLAVAEGGRLLRLALDLGSKPATLGARAAPDHATEGFATLAAAGWAPEVQLLLETAKQRAVGDGVVPVKNAKKPER